MGDLLDLIAQSFIFISGIISSLLIGRKDKYQPWGYFFAVISYPAWLYTLIYNEQWVLLLSSFMYVYGMSLGLYNHLIEPKLKRNK